MNRKVYYQIIWSRKFFCILTLAGIFICSLFTNMNLYLIGTKSAGDSLEIIIQRIVISAVMIMIFHLNLYLLLRELLQICICDLLVLVQCGFFWRDVMKQYMFALARYGVFLMLAADILFMAVIGVHMILLGILCAAVAGAIMGVFYFVCFQVFSRDSRWMEEQRSI